MNNVKEAKIKIAANKFVKAAEQVDKLKIKIVDWHVTTSGKIQAEIESYEQGVFKKRWMDVGR